MCSGMKDISFYSNEISYILEHIYFQIAWSSLSIYKLQFSFAQECVPLVITVVIDRASVAPRNYNFLAE